MNFQLFIVPSGEVNADPKKTERSFLGLPKRVCIIKDWVEINYLKADYEWFGIFYDNEAIDWKLRGSIIEFLNSVPIIQKYNPIQCVSVYKKIMGNKVVVFSGTPRLFHRAVFIGSNCEPVCRLDNIVSETIFGGFITEHGLCIRPSTNPKMDDRS